MIKEKLFCKKGITLISLILTIILLVILSTTIAFSTKAINKVRPYNNMIADINLLNDKVLVYYNKYRKVPRTNRIWERNIAGVGNVKYYEIDLSKLEGITLNYGKDYKKTEELTKESDVYLINSNLHVYYLKGVENNGQRYHFVSNNENYAPDIEEENIDIPQEEYAKLEYIETTGTQYIDLQHVVSGDLEIKGEVYTSTQGKEMCIVGVVQTGAAMEVGFSAQSNRFFAYSKKSLGVTPTDSIYNNKIKFNAKFNAVSPYKELTLNNLYSSSTEVNSSFIGQNLQLFRLDTRYYFTGRLYYLKIYDNKSLVREFVPCKDPNEVVCLYDKVECKYYYNQGTGDFIAGPEV